MPENTETLDHKAEALRLLEFADGCSTDEGVEADHAFMRAFVLSNLAIAEGQERVAEEIASLRGELHEIGQQINYVANRDAR